MKKSTAVNITGKSLGGLTSGISYLILICFFLSGLTGLIYEILWTRMIVKVIGSAPFAVSIVLTVFMGGLGIGSYIAGKTIDRVNASQKLLRFYALLELAIGVYAIFLPGLIILFKPLYRVLYNQLFQYSFLYNVLTLTGCVALLILPVTCMGATLPVLCRFYIDRLGHLGTRAGRLYGINTIGAAFGSLLCGFWLIEHLGVWGSLIFAMALNMLIGVACYVASYRLKPLPVSTTYAVSDTPSAARSPEKTSSPSAAYVNGALFIFAISGFSAMAYEVMWIRLLGLIIGPTTYSFTVVLVTFIIGLAVGSLIFGWLADATKQPMWLLIITQLGAAFLALGVSQLLGNSQFFFAKLIYHFQDHFTQLTFVKACLLFVIMVGPTVCLGATFPLVGKIYTYSLAQVGKRLGVAYAINTLGAVLGAFCAGFILIPYFGKEHGLRIVIGLQLFTSLFIAGYLLRGQRAQPLRWTSLAVTMLLALICCVRFPTWNRQLLSMGKYQRFEHFSTDLKHSGWLEALYRGPAILEKYHSKSNIVYYGDGVGGFTTVVEETDVMGTPIYRLFNSGKPDASSRGDMPTQVLSAHLPMLMHPDPREVMVLGLASGITAGEILHYPIERLDIIEISEQVVAASNFFNRWNNNVLAHPKTNLILQDGRAHLELTNRRYDVIISEPSNPWMAGLASLFTKEFFLLAQDRLNESGIFVQFFHSYQMDWPTYALILRTFSEVFPRNLLVRTIPSAAGTLPVGGDYLMIGLKGDHRLMLHNVADRMHFAQASQNMVLSNASVICRLIISEDLQQLCGPGPIHSDNFPYLEFSAPKRMYTVHDPDIEKNLLSRRWLDDKTKQMLEEASDAEGQIAFAQFALSLHRPFPNMVDFAQFTPEQKDRLLNAVEEYCTHSGIDDYSVFDDQELRARCARAQIDRLEKNIHSIADRELAYAYLANAYRISGELYRAIDYYKKLSQVRPESVNAYVRLGEIYSAQGLIQEAIDAFNKALEIAPHLIFVYHKLVALFELQGRMLDAATLYQLAIKRNPDAHELYNNLAWIYATHPNPDMRNGEEAVRLATKACQLTNFKEAMPLDTLAAAYAEQGNFTQAVKYQHKAIALASAQLSEALRHRLELYQNKQPYRESK